MTRFTLAAASLALLSSVAQAAVILDEGLNNTGTNSTISATSGKAINFTMGSGPDTILTTIELGIGTFTNTPTPIVQLWSNHAGTTPINTLLTTLNNPSTFMASSVNAFTHTGFTLTPGTTYWVVVLSTTSADGFQWLGASGVANQAVTSSNGSTHTARVFADFADTSPAQWDGVSGVLNQVRITAIPEPSAALLGGLGMLALLRRRR